MTFTAGTSVGHYEIRQLIGKGGMGEVYLAEDTELDRPVALKILSTSLERDPRRLEGLVREAKAASALNHPNILTIHDICSFDHSRYIVMEYVDGETLRKRMDSTRMHIGEVLDISVQIASALSAAHQAEIVHRDIKPQNIMVRPDGQVKIVDFGLAELAKSRALTTDLEAPTRSYDNEVIGTPFYMSPEQVCGCPLDARTDIWSLGVIVYEMVTGSVPFDGASANEVFAQVLDREPISLSKKAVTWPAELQWILTKALSKDRGDRYQSAKELAIDLKRLKAKLDVKDVIGNASSDSATFDSEPNLRARKWGIRLTTSVNGDGDGIPNSGGVLDAEYSPSEFRHYKWMALINFGLLLATSVLVAYMSLLDRNSDAPATIVTIAVLPFVTGSESETEYLADGISESLINSLAGLDQVRVVARSTAFRYKGSDIDPANAGRELKVSTVLTGRVKQVGNDLDIQAELVDTATGAQLWGKQYSRKASDLVGVKQDIAREITEKLRLRLNGEDQQRMINSDTVAPEAYRLYLSGRFNWNRRDPGSLKKAINDFNEAIARDPNYALAYIGLADSLVLSSEFNFGDSPATEVYPKAKAAIARALAIDDSLAEAHTSLAYIRSHYEWNYAAAEEEFKRAIALNPRYPTAHHWYARHLMAMGRFAEAAAEINLARELDPLSPIIVSTVGDPFYFQRQYDRVIEQNKKALELEPNFPRGHFQLMLAYQATNRFEDAIAQREKLGASREAAAALRKSFTLNGKAGYWKKLAEIVENEGVRGTTLGDHDEILLRCFLASRKNDRAFEILERMYRKRFEGLIFLKVDPLYDPVRNDPRFVNLLGRMEAEIH